MSLQVNHLRRVFVYNGAELADPGPLMSPAEVADAYSPAFPELLNVSIEGPVVSGDKIVYTFSKAAGGKG